MFPIAIKTYYPRNLQWFNCHPVVTQPSISPNSSLPSSSSHFGASILCFCWAVAMQNIAVTAHLRMPTAQNYRASKGCALTIKLQPKWNHGKHNGKQLQAIPSKHHVVFSSSKYLANRMRIALTTQKSIGWPFVDQMMRFAVPSVLLTSVPPTKVLSATRCEGPETIFGGAEKRSRTVGKTSAVELLLKETCPGWEMLPVVRSWCRLEIHWHYDSRLSNFRFHWDQWGNAKRFLYLIGHKISQILWADWDTHHPKEGYDYKQNNIL